MVNMQQLMQQAQKIQKQLTANQEKMKNTDFEGEAGGGSVKIIMNGNYETKKININKDIIDPEDKEMLEDLIVVAFNNCKSKIDDTNKESLGGMTGNMNLNSFF